MIDELSFRFLIFKTDFNSNTNACLRNTYDNSNHKKFALANDGTSFIYLSGLMYDSNSAGKGPYFAKLSYSDLTPVWEFGSFGTSNSINDYANNLYHFKAGINLALFGCGLC